MSQNSKYKILAIDTSCDETSAAVTEGTKILSNIIWSLASLHAKFGGVLPSLAQREHEKRIDFVVDRAIKNARCKMTDIDAVAVTLGPGLAIALGVGINRTKEMAIKYHKPLIGINHLEGHVLSALARPKNDKSQISKDKLNKRFPAVGLVVSGGNTVLVLIKNIGKYEILAKTEDDALGESLDKAARMLGLGYPGGAILEIFARLCSVSAKQGPENPYALPVPIIGQEERRIFTYSGLKTAMWRLVEREKQKSGGILTKDQIINLAAIYQDVAFKHLIRVITYIIRHSSFNVHGLFIGGGVAANTELRKRIRKMCKEFKIPLLSPYSKKLYGDNGAMIGVAAYFKYLNKEFIDLEKIDRLPNLKIDQKI
jgi:N6-L-threonylcarbamoyladenine synthase